MKKIVFSVIIIAILTGGSWYYFSSKKPVTPEFFVAKRMDVTQEVSANGRIKPETHVDLAFEKGGRIVSTETKIGQKIYVGEILAKIDDTDILSQLSQAEASVQTQKAKLSELLTGTRSEEIQIYEAKEQSATVALSEAEKNLVEYIKDAYTKSDDAIRNKADQFLDNPTTANPKLNLLDVELQLKINIEAGRLALQTTIVEMADLANEPVSPPSPSSVIQPKTIASSAAKTKNGLNIVKNFLEKMAEAVNGLRTNSSITQATIDTYKASISTARTSINTTIANFSVAEEKYKTAESNLIVAKNELALKKSGATNEQIKTQEALIEEAKASVENYQAQLTKTILRSPINGTVVKMDAKNGEIATIGVVLISVSSETQYKIEANVPEADIAKIKINDTAKVELDAYSNEIFDAVVSYIDPAGVIMDGVPTYKTTFHFTKTDPRFKAEMSADITVLAAKSENAIAIPTRLIFQKDGEKFVKILNDDNLTTTEVKIKTGLRGSDGNTEILEGVNEENRIVK